ncbi:MAG: YqzL family protein [Vulcanimicrobiaceae bacterium]
MVYKDQFSHQNLTVCQVLCQVLAGAYGGVTIRSSLVKKYGVRPLRTSEFFWKLFANTGSVNAYLMYRKLNPIPVST